MASAIKLSDEVIERVKAEAIKQHRSVPKQIEFLVMQALDAQQTLTTAQKMELFKKHQAQHDEAYRILAQ